MDGMLYSLIGTGEFSYKSYLVKLVGRQDKYEVYDKFERLVFSRPANAIAYWALENFLESL